MASNVRNSRLWQQAIFVLFVILCNLYPKAPLKIQYFSDQAASFRIRDGQASKSQYHNTRAIFSQYRYCHFNASPSRLQVSITEISVILTIFTISVSLVGTVWPLPGSIVLLIRFLQELCTSITLLAGLFTVGPSLLARLQQLAH